MDRIEGLPSGLCSRETPVLKSGTLEVEKQSNLDSGGFEVVDHLRLVLRSQSFHGLEFDGHLVFYRAWAGVGSSLLQPPSRSAADSAAARNRPYRRCICCLPSSVWTGRGGQDRTGDLLLPKQARFRCATPRHRIQFTAPMLPAQGAISPTGQDDTAFQWPQGLRCWSQYDICSEHKFY